MEASPSKDEAHKKWRAEWLQQITRSRDMDLHFKELLAKDRVFRCEKHFEPFLPLIGYVGLYRCEGYGFQRVWA